MSQKSAIYHEEWIATLPEARKISLESLVGQYDALSSEIKAIALPDKFINARQELLAIEGKQAGICHKGLEESLEGGTMDKKDFDKAVARLTAHRFRIGRERVVLKRSRRTLIVDLTEMRPIYDSLSETYARLISSEGLGSLTVRGSPMEWANRKLLNKKAYQMYGCSRVAHSSLQPDDAYFWCPIAQEEFGPSRIRAKSPPVKITHIVPSPFLRAPGLTEKLFDDEPMRLEMRLRNTLPLLRYLANLFDNYTIVIVPKGNEGGAIPKEFRCVLANKAWAQYTFNGKRKLGDIDGVQLKFLNHARPASRYLYLKYCCAFLYWQQEGQTEWAETPLLNGYIWDAPDEYLRRSMLTNLAWEGKFLALPETFYRDNTFVVSESEGPEIRDVDQEDANNTFTGEIIRMYKATGRLQDDNEVIIYAESSESESD